MRAKIALRLSQNESKELERIEARQIQEEHRQAARSPLEILNACLAHPLGWPLAPLVLPFAALQRASQAANESPGEGPTRLKELEEREKQPLTKIDI